MTHEELLKKREQVLLKLMEDPMYQPMRLREIALFLDVPKSKRRDLEETLDALVREGRIRISKSGKYGKPEKEEKEGIFAANAKGFGFVRIPGEEHDVFIPRDKTRGALQGDTVRILIPRGQQLERREGRVVEIVTRGVSRLVGYYRRENNGGVVIPDNARFAADVVVPKKESLGAETGQKVVVEITRYPKEKGEALEGRVTELLGRATAPGIDLTSIVRSFDIPDSFSEECLIEAAHVAKRGRTEETEPRGRRDLRALCTVTIDGEDSKDLDDAISLDRLENGNLLLGVHIADVSEYVREGGALDRTALNRGTSVYLPDRVIPMLPVALSNGICSLNEGEDRLALSCLMEFTPTGEQVRHEICESVIRSDRRLTYTTVNQIVTNHEPELCEHYAELVPMLEEMDDLARSLRERRSERGYIDFDFPESKVILSPAGKPLEIRAYERNEATRLIEDFMLAANETVAKTYCLKHIPFVYRIHEAPTTEKLQVLKTFVANFGLNLPLKNGEVTPREIQKLLLRVEGTETEDLVSRMALRTMTQASYSVDCVGHFGLASRYYTHFTSPIRRYPDLQIHRIIKEHLRNGMNAKRTEHYRAVLPGVAEQASKTERRAQECERDAVKFKKCEYMEQHINEVFDGIISGVTRYGIYVELKNTVDGMIRVSELRDDRYQFNEEKAELVGEFTKKRYRLGEPLRVRVTGADRLLRTVDFILEPALPADEED